MPICPQCRRARVGFDAPGCDECGWRVERPHGVPSFLSGSDRSSPLLSAYMELYDRIAGDDLEQSIQGEELLELEATRLLEQLEPVRGAAVCDVGVGTGMLFDKLRAGSPELLVGIDLALAYLRRLEPADGVRLLQANAENLPFRAEFDLVVASDVLEHVLNAADMLATAREALRPGGRLVVKVPYREDLSQYRTTESCPYPMVHLRTFNRALLKEMLEHAGFAVERFSYSGFYAGRWHRPIRRVRGLGWLLQKSLERAYGANPAVNRIDPRLGRMLMRPVAITAVARPRASVG